MKASRKKPCPYCEKRLAASSKGKWRRNLARHLSNCLPYQRETMGMMTRFVLEAVVKMLPQGALPVGSFYQSPPMGIAPNVRAEVEALERLHKL